MHYNYIYSDSYNFNFVFALPSFRCIWIFFSSFFFFFPRERRRSGIWRTVSGLSTRTRTTPLCRSRERLASGREREREDGEQRTGGRRRRGSTTRLAVHSSPFFPVTATATTFRWVSFFLSFLFLFFSNYHSLFLVFCDLCIRTRDHRWSSLAAINKFFMLL